MNNDWLKARNILVINFHSTFAFIALKLLQLSCTINSFANLPGHSYGFWVNNLKAGKPLADPLHRDTRSGSIWPEIALHFGAFELCRHTHTHNSTLCTAFNMLPSLLDAAGHAGCPLKIPTRPCGVYATNWHVVAPTASGGTPNKYTTIYMYTRIWCMCWDFLNFWHFSIHLKKCHIVCREREGERQTRRMKIQVKSQR